MSDSETTINIPQIAVIVIFGVLVLRWFLSTPSSSSATVAGTTSSSSSSSSRAGVGTTPAQRAHAAAAAAAARVSPAQVELLASMFPQLNRRDILWDLQRNGGNVQATTERVLTGRGLENPPPTFQPPMLANISEANSHSAAHAAVQTGSQSKPATPDLIQRHKLHDKVSSTTTDESESDRIQWSNSKNERQTMLQKRREEMILAARRKMLNKGKNKAES